MASMRCKQCGRALTNSRSQMREYGPSCWKYIQRLRYDLAWKRWVGKEAEGP